MENTLKQKYTDIVKTLKQAELKKFNKTVFKDRALQDLKSAFPDPKHQKRLDVTALCIANALDREAKELLRQNRETTSRDHVSSLLSSTVIADLDNTLTTDVNDTSDVQHRKSHDEYVNDAGHGDMADEEGVSEGEGEQTVNNHYDVSDGEANDSLQQLDSSITLLKQIATTSDKSKSNKENTKNTVKCCDSCKVKPKSKARHEMIRCSACMTWFHETCVGIAKGEPIGLWLCPICREIPNKIQQEITCVQDEVNELKRTTNSILSAVSQLSKTMENHIGGINDRLIALSKQIKSTDKTTSESIENVASETQNVKELLDLKSGLILNKSNSILDRVKNLNGASDVAKPSPSDTQTQNKQTVPKNQTKANQPTLRKAANKQAEINKTPKHKEQKSKTQDTKAPQSRGHIHIEESIDLTESDHHDDDVTIKKNKVIKQSTLLIGSSLLKNVKISDLNKSTAVRSFPGATIDTIKIKLSEFNLENCKTIILLVGGNDADNGTDLETFTEKYESLLNALSADDRRVIVAGLLPRETVDLSAYNNKLRELCDACDTEFVENYDNFLLASGELPESYYLKDKVHLNNYGTRKLLSNIDKVHRIKRQSQSVQHSSDRVYRPVYRHNNDRGSRPGNRNRPQSSKYCHICVRNGHNTQECWFNGRNDGWSMRQPR